MDTLQTKERRALNIESESGKLQRKATAIRANESVISRDADLDDDDDLTSIVEA